MKRFIVINFVLWSILMLPSCEMQTNSDSTDSAKIATLTQQKPPETYNFEFKSYDDKYGPPKWWKGDTFQLSQAYPKNYDEIVNSPCPESECTWEKQENNFKTNPINYLKEVIKYAYEGNLEANWVVQKNTKGRKWFHAPYMHLDIVDPLTSSIKEKVAREFTHGLTFERPACISELRGESKCNEGEQKFENWAISIYNERGGAYIGKVWNEILNPKSGVPDPQLFSGGFPDGTVVIKLLFTQAPPEQIGYLANSIKWEADTKLRVNEKEESEEFCKQNHEKCFPPLRLLQIDIAVKHKDDAQVPTSWVFATFTVDNEAEPFIDYKFSSVEEAELNKGWLQITPLGLMFGNDPKALKGQEIVESILNRNLKIPQHYGCGDDADRFKRRLNGPVDNPKSSCLSCHAQSETPKDLNIGDIAYEKMDCVNDGENNIAYWFRNINPHNSKEPTFTPSTDNQKIFSLDYSLQLREGIRRYSVQKSKKLNIKFEKGGKFTVVTRDGDKTFTIQ